MLFNILVSWYSVYTIPRWHTLSCSSFFKWVRGFDGFDYFRMDRILGFRVVVCCTWGSLYAISGSFLLGHAFYPLGFQSETGGSMWTSLSARRTAYASPLKWMLLGREFSSEIFVSGLSFYTTDEKFREAFLPFGDVKEARLIKDARTKRPKGYGFVTYESEAEAQKAIKAMDGRIFGGRLMFVETAKPRSKEDMP